MQVSTHQITSRDSHGGFLQLVLGPQQERTDPEGLEDHTKGHESWRNKAYLQGKPRDYSKPCGSWHHPKEETATNTKQDLGVLWLHTAVGFLFGLHIVLKSGLLTHWTWVSSATLQHRQRSIKCKAWIYNPLHKTAACWGERKLSISVTDFHCWGPHPVSHPPPKLWMSPGWALLTYCILFSQLVCTEHLLSIFLWSAHFGKHKGWGTLSLQILVKTPTPPFPGMPSPSPTVLWQHPDSDEWWSGSYRSYQESRNSW